MTDTWPFTVAALAAGAAAVYSRTRDDGVPERADLDIAKAGQLIGIAAEWLRAGDVGYARWLLDHIPDDVWQFAHDEVVAVSPELRVAAMAGRMSAHALLTTPQGVSVTVDRPTQVETLNLIAKAIRTRMKPT